MSLMTSQFKQLSQKTYTPVTDTTHNRNSRLDHNKNTCDSLYRTKTRNLSPQRSSTCTYSKVPVIKELRWLKYFVQFYYVEGLFFLSGILLITSLFSFVFLPNHISLPPLYFLYFLQSFFLFFSPFVKFHSYLYILASGLFLVFIPTPVPLHQKFGRTTKWMTLRLTKSICHCTSSWNVVRQFLPTPGASCVWSCTEMV